MQAVELVEDIAAADLQAAMVFVHSFVELMRRFLGGGLEGVKEIPHGIGQFGLVVLYRKDVILPSMATTSPLVSDGTICFTQR